MPVITHHLINMRTVRVAKVAAKRKIKEAENQMDKEEDRSSSSGRSSEEEGENCQSSSSSSDCIRTYRRSKRPRKLSRSSDSESNYKEEQKPDIDCSESEKEKEDDEFYVESVRDMKIKKGKKFFFVKWLGWPESANSWEPEENMTGSNRLIMDFINKKETDRACTTKDLNRKIINSTDNLRKAKNLKTDKPAGEKKSITRGNSCSSITGNNPSGVTFVFRIWVDEQQQVQLLCIDLAHKVLEEEYYKVVLTEDLQGKDPKWFYGATVGVDGSKYCLVQFEGSEVIDVVPPVNLINQFPYAKKFYEHMEVVD